MDGCSAELMWDSLGKHRAEALQKNWVPFVYKESDADAPVILFSQSLYPHRVVSLSGLFGVNSSDNREREYGFFGHNAVKIENDEDGNVVCYHKLNVIAETSFRGFDRWKYGPLRGGSNGMYVYIVLYSPEL